MRIIVEGPDGCGNTTLITELEKLLKVEREPRRVSKQMEAMVDIRHFVEQDLGREAAQPGIVKLYDRHALISACMYAPIMKARIDDWMVDRAWVRAALWDFWQAGNMIIYCLPPHRTMLDNIMASMHEQPGSMTPQRAIQLHCLYELHYLHPLNVPGSGFRFKYDYTNTDDPLGEGLQLETLVDVWRTMHDQQHS